MSSVIRSKAGMRRVAQRGLDVRLHGRDPAAGPGQPRHLGRPPRRASGTLTSNVRAWTRSNEPAGSPVCRASAAMTSTLARPRLGGELGGHGRVPRVGVHAGHPASRRHPLGQQLEDAARPAAQVDRALPGPQADPVQQRGAVARPGPVPGVAAARSRPGCCPAGRPRSGPDWLRWRPSASSPLAPRLLRGHRGWSFGRATAGVKAVRWAGATVRSG